MKKLIGVTLLMLICTIIFSQTNPENDSGYVEKIFSGIELPYTVPDSPALKLITVDKTDILNITTTYELSAILSKFTNETGEIKIPESLGIEIPFKIFIDKNTTLKNYTNNVWFYRSGLSVAVKKSLETNITNMAVGLRMIFNDETDIREIVGNSIEKETQPKIDEINNKITANLIKLNDKKLKKSQQVGNQQTIDNIEKEIAQIKHEIVKLNSQADAVLNNYIENKSKQINWAGNSLQAAIAIAGRYEESISNTLQLDRISLWGTMGKQIINNKFRCLIGLNGLFMYDQSIAVGLAGRLYGGSNDYQVYLNLDGEALWTLPTPDFSMNISILLGTDSILFVNNRIDASLGALFDGSTYRWIPVTNFMLKTKIK